MCFAGLQSQQPSKIIASVIELNLFIYYNFMIDCNYYIIVFINVCEIIKISLFWRHEARCT